MKRLGKVHQISGQSHAEIISGLGQLTERLTGEDETYLGKKLTYGFILNGLALLLLDEPEEEQLRLAVRALRRLEMWAMEYEVPEEARGLLAFLASRGDLVPPTPISGSDVSDLDIPQAPNDLSKGQGLQGNDVRTKPNSGPSAKRRPRQK
jgi:hypothetical protein